MPTLETLYEDLTAHNVYDKIVEGAISVPEIPRSTSPTHFHNGLSILMQRPAAVIDEIASIPNPGIAKHLLELIAQKGAHENSTLEQAVAFLHRVSDHDVALNLGYTLPPLSEEDIKEGKRIETQKEKIHGVLCHAYNYYTKKELFSSLAGVTDIGKPEVRQAYSDTIKAAADYGLYCLEQHHGEENKKLLGEQYHRYTEEHDARIEDKSWMAEITKSRTGELVIEPDHDVTGMFLGRELFNRHDEFIKKINPPQEAYENLQKELVDALRRGIDPLHGGVDLTYAGHHQHTIASLARRKRNFGTMLTILRAVQYHADSHDGNLQATGIYAEPASDIFTHNGLRILQHLTLIALECNDEPMLKLLIKNGSDINAVIATESGEHLLHFYAKQAHLPAVRLLLAAGADKTLTDGAGNLALHHMAETGNAEGIALFAPTDADNRVANRAGAYPLHMVAKKGNKAAIDALNAPAELRSATTRQGLTPIDIAAIEGNVEALAPLVPSDGRLPVATLFSHSVLKSATAFHYAAASKPKDSGVALIVKLKALFGDAALTGRTEKGYTPIDVAARYGNIAIMPALLPEGPLPVNDDFNGFNALHIAIINWQNIPMGNQDAVTLLMAHVGSAGLSVTEKHGFNALQLAVLWNNLPACKLLFPHYESLPKTITGQNLLHLAVSLQGRHRDTELIPFLLTQMDEHARSEANHGGQTPFDQAVIYAQLPAMQQLMPADRLLHRDEKGNNAYHLAANNPMRIDKGDNQAAINFLLLHIGGGQLGERNNENMQPIDYATANITLTPPDNEQGNNACHVSIINKRDDPYIRFTPNLMMSNKDGFIPVELAIQYQDIHRVLLMTSISPKQHNRMGDYVLHIAVRNACSHPDDNASLLTHLVKSNDRNVILPLTNSEGLTALELAIALGKTSAISIISGMDELGNNDLHRAIIDTASLPGGTETRLNDIIRQFGPKALGLANKAGQTALDVAIACHHPLAYELLSPYDPDNPALHLAVQHYHGGEAHHLPLIKALITMYGDICLHRTNKDGHTPIEVAVMNNNAAAIETLIPEDDPTRRCLIPLPYLAIKHGHDRVLHELVRIYGQKIMDIPDRVGKLPIHWAATYHRKEMLAICMPAKEGIPCDSRDNTPLHTALLYEGESHHEEVITQIIRLFGKDILNRRNDGVEAFPPFEYAANLGNVAALKHLIPEDGIFKGDLPPLHVAARNHEDVEHGNREVIIEIKRLLEHDKELLVTRSPRNTNEGSDNYNNKGLTPLDVAAIHGNAEAIDLLLPENGALPTRAGLNAFHFAVTNLLQLGDDSNRAVIKKLLELAKDRVQVPTARGRMPIDLAALYVNIVALELLMPEHAVLPVNATTGNTAAHYVFSNFSGMENGEVSRAISTLIGHYGAGILDVPNRKGDTPRMIAAKKEPVQHAYINQHFPPSHTARLAMESSPPLRGTPHMG